MSNNNVAAQAFIAFLRCEAQQAEERAKSLRATAATIEANNLGGARKKHKRDASTEGKSKAHSAYTLFVHENYEIIKKEHTDLPSREIISILAQQWGSTSEEEKQVWKYRAEQVRNEPFPTIPGMMPDVPEMDEDTQDEEDVIDDETGGGKRRASRRDPVTPSISV